MDWPLIRLDELYDIARGGSPRPIKKFLTNDANGVNWIKIGDATASEKYIYETKEKIIPEGINRSRFVNKGDFLLSNSMSFGRPYIMGTTGCIHDGWLVLSPKDELIDQDFLYYLLGSPFVFQQFDSLAAGSTVRNLNIDLVSSVKIPLLPLEEQKRIVAILDQAFADIDKARALTEQNLKNARELFESYLQKVFSQRGEGWVEKTLGDAVVVERGSSPRPIKKFQTGSEDGVNWVKIGDAKEGQKYINKTKEKITREGATKSRFVDIGDFILSNSMSFGRPYIMAIQGYIHDGWFVLRLPEDIDSNYFYYLLSSPYLKSQFHHLAAGAIVKNISGDLVKKAILPLPSIDKQKEIALKLDLISREIDLLEDLYHRKATQVDELKKSILQKAFSGELTKDSKEAAA
ncbi:restriction endonuclease subunit S [Gilvimarinus sp. SDUM040013]|uniref:Restriction endonuclease subunit S n=1 Tax=Gilvimarinus gilvus TaxID=3058038 RepID=A0ABU4RZU0_9GAMM|nr:restriction endonuclease subunit S [Gilvimarinus sp. SDUM040013]MDO3384771.1 restriction endonuclease subunit S [Gilvimarinus sp. SDUM040013]MDX6850411.1 restriction endonuclease subunit S [Gilvimarinus sp. SDUM040013]